MRTLRRLGGLVVCVGAALLAASPAGASVTTPVQVTGSSPFVPGCAGPGHDPTGRLYEEGEVEPWVAVDPADASNIAGNWQQDRWSDGGSHGYVYAIWDRLVVANSHANLHAVENAIGYRGPTWFASSANSGQSWSPARKIYDPGENNQTIANQIAVEPDGTLLDVFILINNFKNAHGTRGLNVAVMRSSDHGLTWSRPVIVSKLADKTVVTPGDNLPVRTGDIIPDIAIDRSSGAAYVVWQDARSGTPAIYLAKSTDGGVHWSAPQKVSDSPAAVQAFTGSVDVNSNGAGGVTFFDFRNDTSSTPTALTDYWFRASTDGGAGWGNSPGGTPTSFDMKTAPVARGFFVGDYEGLDHAGSTFKVFFVQTDSTPGPSPTYVFSANAT